MSLTPGAGIMKRCGAANLALSAATRRNPVDVLWIFTIRSMYTEFAAPRRFLIPAPDATGAGRSTYLPAFLMKPVSASGAVHSSHRKQSGCQLVLIALMTRPMMNASTTTCLSAVDARKIITLIFHLFILFSQY